MEKEKVLEFEIINNNEIAIVGKLNQNTELLKRRKDTKFSRSYIYPCWDIIRKELYTYGSNEKYDNLIFPVPKEDIDLFLDKINAINKKYGKPKRWRAEVGERYYYINLAFEVWSTLEKKYENDDDWYKLGNYFKTKKEAQLYADKIKKLLSERK